MVLGNWPLIPPPPEPRFTTIASWRGAYGQVEVGGHRFGLKAHEFRKFRSLPGRAPYPFELALDIHPGDDADRVALANEGWLLKDPKTLTADPAAFRAYVQASGAEFSVAQGIYVETNSGWFSDRSARYLATGRPVLLQDTGFSRHLPTGQGLVAFHTLDEAIAGATAIMADYPKHCIAARRVAEEHFDSDRVISQVLKDAEVTA